MNLLFLSTPCMINHECSSNVLEIAEVLVESAAPGA
jgi:hypothetical protein